MSEPASPSVARDGRKFQPSERLVLTPKGERWVVRVIWASVFATLTGWAAILVGTGFLLYLNAKGK